MPRGTNQKLKLLYLSKIMQEKTDDEHGITMAEVIRELEKYDITAERKSIYADFADMTDKLGMEIIKEQTGRETYYHIGRRQFELAEVKLLIDAIQSSKLITQKKSRELIGKIKTLVSEHQAKQLQRQVYINDRVKTMNESVYYNVDDIHSAINQNRKVSFRYYKWDISKELVAKHNGARLEVSPWALIWDDENYYMVAYDAISQKIKHYRVDKMMHISVCDEERDGRELFSNFDMASYSKATFGMYGGRMVKVDISFPNEMCGVFIDRFGKELLIKRIDENSSYISVDVAVSSQFYGWIFGLGKGVRVIGPKEVTDQMHEAASEFIKNYSI